MPTSDGNLSGRGKVRFCEFSAGACPRCGARRPAHYVRNCSGPPLWGTRLARLLKRVGLTPERWTRWTATHRMVGGMATCRLVRVPQSERRCGCADRESWLNRLHAWLRRR